MAQNLDMNIAKRVLDMDKPCCCPLGEVVEPCMAQSRPRLINQWSWSRPDVFCQSLASVWLTGWPFKKTKPCPNEMAEIEVPHQLNFVLVSHRHLERQNDHATNPGPLGPRQFDTFRCFVLQRFLPSGHIKSFRRDTLPEEVAERGWIEGAQT